MDDMDILHSRSRELRPSQRGAGLQRDPSQFFAISMLYLGCRRRDRKNDTTNSGAGRCDRKEVRLASRAHGCATRRQETTECTPRGQLIECTSPGTDSKEVMDEDS
jgi:hypothetical protein